MWAWNILRQAEICPLVFRWVSDIAMGACCMARSWTPAWLNRYCGGVASTLSGRPGKLAGEWHSQLLEKMEAGERLNKGVNQQDGGR